MQRRNTEPSPITARGAMIALAAAIVAVSVGGWMRHQATRWMDRESTIAMKQEQLVRLRALLGQADAVRDSVVARDARYAAMPRLVTARSAAAAGAEVQTLVQDEAQSAGVSVQSLDIAGDAETLGAIAMVPVTVTAIGDIHGVTAWLHALHGGPRLLDIRELTITPNSALRGEPLQVSMTLRAPFVGGAP